MSGLAGLKAFLEPLIASAPWYERGMIRAHLSDEVENGLVTAVQSGGRPALDVYIDALIAQQTSFKDAIAAYMNDDFRNKVVAAIEGPKEGEGT